MLHVCIDILYEYLFIEIVSYGDIKLFQLQGNTAYRDISFWGQYFQYIKHGRLFYLSYW